MNFKLVPSGTQSSGPRTDRFDLSFVLASYRGGTAGIFTAGGARIFTAGGVRMFTAGGVRMFTAGGACKKLTIDKLLSKHLTTN